MYTRSRLFIIFLFYSAVCFSQDISLDITSLSRLAVLSNVDIQIARLRYFTVSQEYEKSQSIFDTFVAAQGYFLKDTTKSNMSNFTGTDKMQRFYELSLNKNTPFGASLGMTASLDKNKSDSGMVSINPSQEATISMELSQSLGKNMFGLSDRGKVKIAFIEKDIARLKAFSDIEKYLGHIQKAYWYYVLSLEKRKIALGFVKEARKLVSIYKDKIKIGLVEEPDLFAALASLKKREIFLREAEAEVQKAGNDLACYLGVEDINIIPEDKLETKLFEPDFAGEMKEAVSMRRDYKIAKKNLAARSVNLVIKKNALWPKIDLSATFSLNGLASSSKNALSGISGEDNKSFSVGLAVDFSLEKKKEHAERRQAELSKKKAVLLIKQVEDNIFRQIKNMVIEVKTASFAVRKNKKIERLQREKLKAEIGRLKYGRSSSDIIIRYEDDYLEAQIGLAQSYLRYRQSLVDLKMAKNSLLQGYGGGDL